MARRMIDSRMWKSRKFKAMPPMARQMQQCLINTADDQGRCLAHPEFIIAEAFLYERVTVEEVQVWLNLMVCNGTIILYQAGSEDYLQFINWWEYQEMNFARPSLYPAPEGWDDRIFVNGKANITLCHNWHKADGTKMPDTCDARGKPLPFVAERIAAQKGNKPQPEVPTQVPTLVPTQVNKEELNIREDQEEEEKESNSNGAGAPPARPCSSRNHPAIKSFHELHNRYPNKTQMAAIIEHDPPLEDWRRAIRAWDMAGHNPTNIQGMLDWALDPSRIEGNQRGGASKEQRKMGYSEYDYLLAPVPKQEAAP